MFAAPTPRITERVNALDLIPDEHREEAARFFERLAVHAEQRGVTIAEALADALRPHLRVLRRSLGVEAFEERALTITDAAGNEISFALREPDTRQLRAGR
jgi:hypothetical protein